MRLSELKRLREARGLSREELASRSGVSFWAIRAHELKLVRGVQTSTAEALAKALEVPVLSLFGAFTEASVSNGIAPLEPEAVAS